MPESVKNRPSGATEEIFLLANAANYYYDHEAIRESSGANLRNEFIASAMIRGNRLRDISDLPFDLTV